MTKGGRLEMQDYFMTSSKPMPPEMPSAERIRFPIMMPVAPHATHPSAIGRYGESGRIIE
ncbi:MAG TPA: hypothetical protein VNW90_25505 [Acetobacteraceae bacterium]|nr:hypothetical protein [Acetobacteraceae bacterium]